MSILDGLLGFTKILFNGVFVAHERTVNFTGDGVEVTHDPVEKRLDVAFTAGTSIGGSTGASDNAVLRANGTGGSSVQASSVTITDGGDIVVPATKTVDGRDVSVDGSKLDGIEALADVTDDANVRAALAAATANIAVNARRVTGLADPVDPQDADTKAARDAAISSAAAGGWITAYDRNFTQDSNFTFADGAQTWNGLSWTGEYIASGANSLAVVNGTGLVIDCNNTNTGWFYNIDNAPKIYTTLAALIPSLVWGSSEIRITCHFDAVGTTSFDFGGVAIEKPYVSNQAWTHKVRAGYFPGYARHGQILMEAAEGVITIPSGNKVSRIHLKSMTHAIYSSRATSAADSDPNSAVFNFQDYAIAGIWATATAASGTSVSTFAPRLSNPADVRLVLCAQSGNTNNQCVATFKRLRVEYKL